MSPTAAGTTAPAETGLPRARKAAPQVDPVDVSIDEACRILHLPTIRDGYDELAGAALREHSSYKQFLADLLETATAND